MSIETPFCTIENLLLHERNGSLFCANGKNDDILTHSRRLIVSDWLLDVSKMFKMIKDTWFAAITLMDICLNRITDELTKEKIQLYGVACLVIAAKKYEIYVPELSDYIYITDGAYDRDMIIEMEKKVLIALNFNIEKPNIMEYIRLCSTLTSADTIQHTYSYIFCRCFYFRKIKFLPSIVASSANYLACKLTSKEPIDNVFNIPNDFVVALSLKIAKCVDQCLRSSSNGIKSSVSKDLGLIHINLDILHDSIRQYLQLHSHDILVDIPKTYTIQHYDKDSIVIPILESQEYTLKDLPLIIGFKKIELLGKGTYGVVNKIEVKKVENMTDGVYAIKKAAKCRFEEGMDVSFLREMSLLQSLKHPTIINIYGISKKCHSFIIECMDCDLKSYITKNKYLITSHDFQNKCTFELLTGLDYIHSNGVIHRDIKPQNILVGGTWPDIKIKYCDFGCSRGSGLVLENYNFTYEISTLWYRAPEILLGSNEYGPAIDVWSLACTINEICIGDALFQGHTEDTQITLIFASLGTPTNESWPIASTLPNYPHCSFKHENKLNSTPFKCSKKVERVIKNGLILNPSVRASSKKLLRIFTEDNYNECINIIPEFTPIQPVEWVKTDCDMSIEKSEFIITPEKKIVDTSESKNLKKLMTHLEMLEERQKTEIIMDIFNIITGKYIENHRTNCKV